MIARWFRRWTIRLWPQRRTPSKLLTFKKWPRTKTTVIHKGHLLDRLETYQLNGILAVTVLFLFAIIYVTYQFGRVLGLLEVIIFGCHDLLRTALQLLLLA
ncbi:hypothetical protein DM01DRAFT_328342 [Hesseltinella vesiculosa]|uniref:Uncharacterized protein n=1 Tax=Hesseltinella vesiculosa TaxID=101127 RepID=A0A1X2GWN6_9FUNG|nr:hypothetical protein DM01DRAFT_328342 [Hesseltinella vesiculosa]